MIILIILIITLLIGILLFHENYEATGTIMIIVSCATILMALLFFVASRYAYMQEIEAFKSVEQTLKTMRINDSIENTAVQLQVMEQNKWLNRTLWLNQTIFDIWIPDEVMELKPIQ